MLWLIVDGRVRREVDPTVLNWARTCVRSTASTQQSFKKEEELEVVREMDRVRRAAGLPERRVYGQALFMPTDSGELQWIWDAVILP